MSADETKRPPVELAELPGRRIHRMMTEAEFWAHTTPEPNTGCWLWLGLTWSSGYAKLTIRGKQVKASRVAAQLVGLKVEGLFVCHRCDQRSCINPAHLFVANHDENMADMVRKGRAARGARSSSALLNEAQVIEIRRRRQMGETSPQLAVAFGVTDAAILDITSGRSWAHVAGPITHGKVARHG